jgi:hypothetical protein
MLLYYEFCQVNYFLLEESGLSSVVVQKVRRCAVYPKLFKASLTHVTETHVTHETLSPDIMNSSINWAQLYMFHLKTETEFSL